MGWCHGLESLGEQTQIECEPPLSFLPIGSPQMLPGPSESSVERGACARMRGRAGELPEMV